MLTTCSTGPTSLFKIWRDSNQPVEDNLKLYIPPASFPDFRAPAPQNDKKPIQRPASVRGSSVTHAVLSPDLEQPAREQAHFRGGSQRVLVSVTASPERRGKRKRALLLAFPAAPPAAPHSHRKKRSDRERPLHQRRRRGRRSACSEIVEDASSSSSDVGLKCKSRWHRQRQAARRKVLHNTSS